MGNCRLRGSDDDDGKSILYSTKQEMRGRWLDFRFETRFSRGQDGLIGGWLNLEAILDYQGPTVYRGARVSGAWVCLFQDWVVSR